jgi:hypothetical protein
MGILYAKIAGSWTPIQYGTAYADDAETAAGTLTDKAVTPAGLSNLLTAYPTDSVWVGPEAPDHGRILLQW